MSENAITLEHVRRWAKDLRDLLDEDKARKARIDELERKLQAAKVLGLEPELPDSGEGTSSAENEAEGLPEAVRRVIFEAQPNALTPGQIKHRLTAEGVDPERFGVTGSYLYTVLGRLVKRGKIRKQGKRYSVVLGC